MKSYWLWILLNVVVWPFTIGYINLPINQLTAGILGVALYFLLFFIVPLIEKKPIILFVLLGTNTSIATAILFPYNGEFNPFLVLIISLLIAEGFYRLPLRYSLANGTIGAFGLGITVLNSNLGFFIQISIAIYILFLFIALIHYKKTKVQLMDVEARYEAILGEYRDVKRRAVSEEELARQEERVLIAHEIHDSVGHKLTALIMQLEMFRLQINEDHKKRVQSLKELANESLNETRRAVKSLKANDTGGLPGVLRLIRKLELENMMHIHFSVKYGAFSAPLTGEQSFVIYRSVQEALTNIMKHSDTKEAEITFEAPGGSIFRFEIRNPASGTDGYQEGFGLSQMRQRLEKHNGSLKVYQTEGHFIVSGYIKIK
ncbi:signal transduction histidine kinase [Cytobacillus oceanisediminis]|uniref:histidine kinase n=1 Tax=Cytobacillus oceanisediminis TaxID=665099 RepID=A0A2V3AAL0_9BACI|nr:sensor histidine kinase [Cytobacillus oceanisediminis]PWW32294.1 signal transduction histidine kinase [Cytobacillus oceanisediminis]